MYNKIIVALGLEHGHGTKAMEVAHQLLSDGGSIVAVHVIEPVPGVVSYYLPDGHENEVKKTAMDQVKARIGDAPDTEGKVFVCRTPRVPKPDGSRTDAPAGCSRRRPTGSADRPSPASRHDGRSATRSPTCRR